MILKIIYKKYKDSPEHLSLPIALKMFDLISSPQKAIKLIKNYNVKIDGIVIKDTSIKILFDDIPHLYAVLDIPPIVGICIPTLLPEDWETTCKQRYYQISNPGIFLHNGIQRNGYLQGNIN